MNPQTIAILGTYDTKGHEHAFVSDLIQARGFQTLRIDVGTGGDPQVEIDISRDEVAQAGGIDLQALMARHDRSECVSAMAQAAPILLERLVSENRIHGVISLGGGGGTAIASAAMRALPIGFPKLIVSTMAAGNTADYMGTKDIVMMPSIVDVAGLNRISKTILTRAAGAIAGMVATQIETGDEKPLVVASMFGNTTDCVQTAKDVLEAAGYEVLVFHATGAGGRAMESLIDSGLVDGVLDVTTTEWADELVGGVLSAGPHRLEAAGRAGVPTVVAPGCLDMVNFGSPESVPEAFADRRFYHHNPQVTLMRTTPEENRSLGRILAEKLNNYRGPITVMIPQKAISIISAEGQPFHDPDADQALFQSLSETLDPKIPVNTLYEEINAPAFAQACAKKLLTLMAEDS